MAVAGAQVTGFIFISFSQAVTVDNNTEQTIPEPPPPQDIFSYLFNNSLTSMLLSTFIIAIIGVLINKLRIFKKKLDMIEILTKSHVKMKQQAEEREKKFEKRFIDTQTEIGKQIGNLCTKLDTKSDELEKNLDNKTRELEKKIGEVKDEATSALIQYLRENSLGRKR